MDKKDNVFDEKYWINRHKNKDVGWHKDEVHPKLLEHKDFLLFKTSARVFVPCCGKSKDMKWFYDQGCYVVGVDCASQALKEFFDENDMTFSMKDVNDDAQVFSSEDGRIQLFCCNLFRFHEVSDERNFDVIWDRGSLVAINTSERKQYVELMASLVASDFRYLLDSFEYDPKEYGGPPKTMSDEELEGLFGNRFKMKAVSKVECDMSRFGISFGRSRTSLITQA